jgi:hypothetical protein
MDVLLSDPSSYDVLSDGKTKSKKKKSLNVAVNKSKVYTEETAFSPISIPQSDESDLCEEIKDERRLGPDSINLTREDIHRILMRYAHCDSIINLDFIIEDSKKEQN